MANSPIKRPIQIIPGTTLAVWVDSYAITEGYDKKQTTPQKSPRKISSIYKYAYFLEDVGPLLKQGLSEAEITEIVYKQQRHMGPPYVIESDLAPDANGNLLLKAVNHDLDSPSKSGIDNVIINSKHELIYTGKDDIHKTPDPDFGYYLVDVHHTTYPGGNPHTDVIGFKFISPDGEWISDKMIVSPYQATNPDQKPNKELKKLTERAKKIQTLPAKKSYMAPHYVCFQSANANCQPKLYPNLADLLFTNRTSEEPFLSQEEESELLIALDDRRKKLSSLPIKLKRKLTGSEYEAAIDHISYEIDIIDRFFKNHLSMADVKNNPALLSRLPKGKISDTPINMPTAQIDDLFALQARLTKKMTPLNTQFSLGKITPEELTELQKPIIEQLNAVQVQIQKLSHAHDRGIIEEEENTPLD